MLYYMTITTLLYRYTILCYNILCHAILDYVMHNVSYEYDMCQVLVTRNYYILCCYIAILLYRYITTVDFRNFIVFLWAETLAH